MGFGIINFVFALPAVYTIDSFGRRGLLLTTFPFMAIFQFMTGIGFQFQGKKQTVLVMAGMCQYSSIFGMKHLLMLTVLWVQRPF